MYRIIYCFLFVCFLTPSLSAQEQKSVYFEKGPEGTTRLYYDKNYFLVDKDCPYKFMERVAVFDAATQKFNGEFKDFDPNGRLLLAGSYTDGKKNGSFKAYHPNGQLKWETAFVDNEIEGSWKYYYPDGKPMLFLTISKSDFFINQFWDRLGKQQVKDGEGEYNMTFPVYGFTEHGFPLYNRSGRVSNGKPTGIWYTSFVTTEKKPQRYLVLTERFENGSLIGHQLDADFSDMYIPLEKFELIPVDFFPRAEALMAKDCTFDQFTGFSSFIAEKFSFVLEKLLFQSPDDLDATLVYQVQVSKDGNPSRIEIINMPENLSKTNVSKLKQAFNQIYYYLPSYLNDKPIQDKLTVTVNLKTRGEQFFIPPVEIKREKGQ
ncbi:toxin-antitoxin system YwqK family antitoxin [Sphingobacterium sp. Mn56C]|uniref:toxin-antitoxin system YwqK family antitoxin n=1 Tax=Sphingobacterium sp. Mn56C TaxID=3395261 RepID=UPI003BC5347E